MTSESFRILLIDDDEDDFVNLRGILSEIPGRNFEMVWKGSYHDGLKALKEQSFDACLLDFRLGELSGLDLLSEAQRAGSTCPMILLTGFGDFDLDIKAMQSGAADYLVKGQISAPLLERTIRYSIKQALDLRELTEQKENFQTLFNSTFEGIVVHRNGKILDANAATCEIFKADTSRIIDASLHDFIRSDFHAELDQQLSTGRDIKMEAVGLAQDGSELYVSITSRTVNLKGNWASLIAFRDLTQRKQMEAQLLQQDRLASLGLLASSLAHEIGTPLGIIRGRAEMVQKSADEKTKQTMDLIVSQIDRIAKLVNSLLHIARGRQSESTSDVRLKDVLDDVTNLISHELSLKGIGLNIHIDGDFTVRAEAGPLGQVFLNLLVNAIHAIEAVKEKRAGAISILATKSGKEATIAIQDTGTGISEKNISRLFQPFFTTKDIGLGTGLGLATSYKLVHSWGGSIQVQSKEGTGSTFTVSLRT